jgi:hypothetical protein
VLCRFSAWSRNRVTWTRPKWGAYHSPTLSRFDISAFRGLQSRKTRLTYIAESRNAKRCLVVWPVAITADHMSADKGMSGSVSGPVGIRGTKSLGEKKKKAKTLLCASGM